MKKIITIIFLLFLSACVSVTNQGSATWDDMRFGGIVVQGLDNSCGLASLLTITQTHFGDMRYDEPLLLKKYMEDSNEKEIAESMKNGLSLLELEKLAKSIGYSTSKRVLSITDLEKLVSFVPVLVYLEVGEFRHFAVVKGVNKDTVFLADPSRGNVEYSKDKFLSEWKTLKGYKDGTGAALIVVRKEGKFTQKLLKEPSDEIPASLKEIRRQMIFW